MLQLLELGAVVHLGGEGRVGRGRGDGGNVSLVRDVRGRHVGDLPGQVRGGVDMSVVLMRGDGTLEGRAC